MKKINSEYCTRTVQRLNFHLETKILLYAFQTIIYGITISADFALTAAVDAFAVAVGVAAAAIAVTAITDIVATAAATA